VGEQSPALPEGTNRKERKMEIIIKKEIDINELLDSVYNNLWTSSSPWVESIEYDWQDENRADVPVPVVCWNTEADFYDHPDNHLTKVLNKHDILNAFSKVVSGKFYHCGYRITADFDDWDSCCADTIMQVALYGEVVFG